MMDMLNRHLLPYSDPWDKDSQLPPTKNKNVTFNNYLQEAKEITTRHFLQHWGK